MAIKSKSSRSLATGKESILVRSGFVLYTVSFYSFTLYKVAQLLEDMKFVAQLLEGMKVHRKEELAQES